VDVTIFEGRVGQNINELTSELRLKTEEQLVSDGFLEDNRGTYYNKVNGTKLIITKVGQSLPIGYTALPPVEGANNQWNGEKWVDAGSPPIELFFPIWNQTDGWIESPQNITEEMKKNKRKALLNDYMLDLIEEGDYSIEAMQEKALELKSKIK